MSTYASLRHAKWDGKSHIVFVPKGRKKELYGNIRKFLGPVFHELAAQRRSQMLEGHMVQDHVHMLIRIPPQYSVAEVVGYIKGQSAIAVARQCGGRKRKFNGEALWARGYAVSTVGFEAEQMRRYITNQDQLDGQGKDEDGDFSGSLRSLTWQPLGLLTTVKPPALRERPDFSLRYALSITNDEVWNAHQNAKRRLIGYINREQNTGLDVDVLTLGFARRATAYKRGDLIFDDIERLRRLSRDAGRLQLVFAGKAHPRDQGGKQLLQRIIQTGRALAPDIIVTFLPNYDMELARLMVAGVDVWLNTPEPPLEASGTSGMKAALNGVPSLSILDGWWIEGCLEGLTGWAIGTDGTATGQPDNRTADAESLYTKLEQTVIPTFYHDRQRFIDIMRHAMALNGSFFNTQRMIQQYVLKAYFE
jgi:REP element-mobilizing transposase RayT